MMRRAWLLVAAVAALAAACKEGAAPKTLKRDPLADSSDQVMYGVDTYLTDKGLMRAELRADTAYFFDENSRIELRGVHTTFYDNNGKRTSVLTSREGTYNTRLAQTEARKDVVVVGEDGKRLTSEQLRFNQQQNLISSDSAFVLTQPDRTLRGIGFTSDPALRNVHILRGASGTGPIMLDNPTGPPAPAASPESTAPVTGTKKP
jgi:LPS export ABC transporter protein LptC